MRRSWVAVAALAFVASGACGNGGSGGAVTIALSEHEIVAAPTSAEAGEITFNVENSGAETHEFVVVSTDLAPDDLPAAEDGSFDEEQIEIVDEIEDMESGASEELIVDLGAGSYILACNVVEEEDGETEAHYAHGMHTAFEVT